MRLHRFYVKEEIGDKTTLIIKSAELVNQVRRVFRLKIGDKIIIFSGTGFDYECKIDEFGEKTIISSDNIIKLAVTSVSRSRYMPQSRLFLCAALVKKDTFEWIAEKATELGVTDIIPVEATRSEKKSLNLDRLSKIVVEASEQSGRGDVPVIHPIMGLTDAVQLLKQQNVHMLAFHTEGERFGGGRDRTKTANMADTGVFIGPEGGWTPEEVEMFHKENIDLSCLGPQILRAETAVVAALSTVVFGA